MNIGILVYSLTGNTLNVAQKIQEHIQKEGGTAVLERITAENGDAGNPSDIRLKDIPDIKKYDKLIICAPINGFMLCRAMTMYLKGHAGLSGKTVNCFVTQHLKSSFFGGNKGIKQIKSFCENQGAEVKNTANVHWSSAQRDAEIENAAKLMTEF